MTELTASQLGAWRDLASAAAEPNPFFEPECVLPAARHLGEAEVSLLAVADEGGEWLACMPVVPHLERWGTRLPALTGWVHAYAPLGTPLVRASAVATGTAALVQRALRASTFGLVALPWLADAGPVSAALRQALDANGLKPAVKRSYSRAIVRREILADSPLGAMSARHQRDLRRLSRRLGEQLGEPLQVEDLGQAPDAVEGFMTLEASGWKGRAGTALASNQDMVPFCGQPATVDHLVEHRIDERTGEIKRMHNPCLVLDGVTCLGRYHRFCPRGIDAYWREAWLQRLD